MIRSRRWPGAAAVLTSALAAVTGVGLVTVPAAAAPITDTFGDAGTHTFTVPAGVCAVTVDAFGAQGGADEEGPGGLGGRATTALPVTPGETLQVNVGGAGADGSPAGTAGGFNGGGDGGSGTDSGGGGGGGASDVRRAPFGLAERVVIAGGGGGGVRYVAGPSGGAGGGTNGEPGSSSPPLTPPGGGGGTQAAGGAGPELGADGAAGVGGAGGSGDRAGRGGGGGGLFGGGGGGEGRLFGILLSSPGGGGSGFTTDGTGMTTGVRQGNGMVAITHDPDAGLCARPDAQVRVANGGFAGDDVYNTDAAGQTVSSFALRLFTATYEVRVQNDGAAADTFALSGTGNAAGFSVTYLDNGVDVTSTVADGSYLTPSVAPGESHALTVRVNVGLLAWLLGSHATTVTVSSTAQPALTDVVRAVTTTI